MPLKKSTLTRLPLCLLFCGLLAACATGPIKLEQPASSISVAQVRATIEDNDASQVSQQTQVLWGGTVLNVSNLADSTQVEILAYPLDRRQRPMTGRTAQGRFVASYEGFVEPLSFPPGRIVTLLGTLTDPVRGVVGDVDYVYPSINVSESHLWSEQELAPRSRVSFGIGIRL